MSYVATHKDFEIIRFQSKREVLRHLRGALMDEFSATNLYDNIIESIDRLTDKDRQELNFIVSEIEEIKQDELNHQGRLQRLIVTMSEPNDNESYMAGVKGEDVHG